MERAPVRPIVVGVDFSPASRRALATAAACASALGAPVHLVTAVEPLLAEAARVQRQMPAYVDQIAGELRAFAHDQPEPIARLSCEVLEGDAAEQLLAAADRASAQFIGVGTRGRGQAARLLLGSTTQRLLRATTMPVLVTPPAEGEAEAGFGAPRAVVCGIDFSGGSLAAIVEARRIAIALAAPLTLVHASADGAPDGAIDEARARLAAIVKERAPGAATEVRIGGAADVLRSAAPAAGRTLIVVGLRGASQQRPGQTALALLSTSPVPVLAVPS